MAVIPASSEEQTPIETSTAVSAKKENGFHRFIDDLAGFFRKAAPVADQLANAAKPLVALSPLGPEYNLALTGIETAVQADVATQTAATTPLTGIQKMALAVQVATPGLTQILATKGITEPPAVSAAISGFVQNVYNLQTGPTAASNK